MIHKKVSQEHERLQPGSNSKHWKGRDPALWSTSNSNLINHYTEKKLLDISQHIFTRNSTAMQKRNSNTVGREKEWTRDKTAINH